MTSVKDTLVAAKNLININGWTQDNMEHNGSYCILGAISEVTLEDDVIGYIDACNAVKAALKQRGNITGIAAWNDAGHRTKDQVLGLLDEAVSHA